MTRYIPEPEYSLGVNGLRVVDSDANTKYIFPTERGDVGSAIISGQNGQLFFDNNVRVTVSDFPPENPAKGQLWYDTLHDFRTYVYYEGEEAWVDLEGLLIKQALELTSASFEEAVTLKILDEDGNIIKTIIGAGS